MNTSLPLRATPTPIRYIVLRKLASGLRHTLMGELQSIQFLAELGARRVDDSGADGSRTRDFIGKISVADRRGDRDVPFGDRMAAARRGRGHDARRSRRAVREARRRRLAHARHAGDHRHARPGRRGESVEGRGAGAHRHLGARVDRSASRLARHRGRRGAHRRSRRPSTAGAHLDAPGSACRRRSSTTRSAGTTWRCSPRRMASSARARARRRRCGSP